jgi:nucleotide-binding universal stress UspA family protein
MKFLVPTAGPAPAKQNANYIIDLARRLKAELDVVHILDLAAERGPGEEALSIFKSAGNETGVPVRTHMVEGNVVPTIVDMAEDLGSNLIVMGGSSGNLVAEWIVTDVMNKTSVPVVIIPYQG